MADSDHGIHAQHYPIHERHPDATPQAALVVYLILLTLIGAQLGLVWWKHVHQRSYDLVSLIGLWLIPGFVSFHYLWWPFLLTWCFFSIVTLYVFYLCMRSDKLDPSTPRLVFTWFLYSHNVCIAIGAAGYFLFLMELLGASPVVWLLFGKGASFNLLFYGLYFGVLGRDTAEVSSTGLVRHPPSVLNILTTASWTHLNRCFPVLNVIRLAVLHCFQCLREHMCTLGPLTSPHTTKSATYSVFAWRCSGDQACTCLSSPALVRSDGTYRNCSGCDQPEGQDAEVMFTRLGHMQAATMAFGRKLSVNPHVCALCNRDLQDHSHLGGEKPAEPTIQLPCKHLFHELCLKGWTMVGKKDTCPTCMEKTDLRALYADRPWETRNLQWNGMLDFVRYMVVWVPVILTTLHLFLHVLHLDLPAEGPPGSVSGREMPPMGSPSPPFPPAAPLTPPDMPPPPVV